MKSVILLGTLKTSGLSNTATLCDFLVERMRGRGIECETVRLVDHQIPAGTQTDMGGGDEWPALLERLAAADIIVFATPIWWSNQSSLIQRVIERLDALHDDILAGKGSRLDGKVGAIVITGDSDGAQQIIGHICNFFNAIGLAVPPYATLSVLWEKQAKHESPTREELLEKYEQDYASTADRMIAQLVKVAGTA